MKKKTENFSGSPREALMMVLLKGIARLPFPLLYALSDFFAFVLRTVIRYRREVVRSNLSLSFPEKGTRELKKITGRFYRHFADLMLETVKASRMSDEEFGKRMHFSGIEAVNACYSQGKSIILLGMHYNNWEWGFFSQRFVRHQALIVYNPLRNSPRLEKFLVGMRERWGGRSVAVNRSAMAVMRFHKDKTPYILILGADQRPPEITPYWTHFLNQEACFHAGPFKIAEYTGQPVFFYMARKTGRGRYDVEFMPMIADPAGMAGEEILLEYVKTMERFIREKPEYYLWTHKRWKQKRPQGHDLIVVPENRKER